jgi:hypothetical protein
MNFQLQRYKYQRQDLKWSLQLDWWARLVVTYRAHLFSPYTDIKRVRWKNGRQCDEAGSLFLSVLGRRVKINMLASERTICQTVAGKFSLKLRFKFQG